MKLTNLKRTGSPVGVPPSDVPVTRTRRHLPAILAGVLLAVALAITYAGSFTTPFVFDDRAVVFENPSLRSWRTFLSPPSNGMPVTGRPLANLTFAIDHVWSGGDPSGYHVTNLLLHLVAAFLLFDVVRRTVHLVRSNAPAASKIARLPAWATGLCVSAIWALHPLQTASVTYIAQRTEVLAALFVLLTLNLFICSVQSNRPSRWRILAVLSCVCAMASKETAAATPLIVLLYDRTFVAGSFRIAWSRRRWTHVGLASTWLVLAALVFGSGGRGGSAGFASAVPVVDYALTQAEAIAHYLRLALWPEPLVFDYGTRVVSDAAEAMPEILTLFAFGIATIVALVRWPKAGFLGACFFLLLVPSSSVVPVATQTMGEHRMYLALALVATPAVIAAFRFLQRRIAVALLLVVSAGLAAQTIARNRDYRSEIILWSDTEQKAPDNPRAHFNLGRALHLANRSSEAERSLKRAVQLQPRYARAHEALGSLYAAADRLDEALRHFEEAIRIEPRFPAARINRGALLQKAGRVEEAIADYTIALEVEPTASDARVNLAEALLASNRNSEAMTHLLAIDRSSAADPALVERVTIDLARAHNGLGLEAARHGQWNESARHLEQATREWPEFAEAHANLGNVLLNLGRFDEAIARYQSALSIQPTLRGIRENLAIARAGAADRAP